MSASRRVTPLLLFALLACRVGGEYQRPQLELPANFGATIDGAPETAQAQEPAAQWWALLGDEKLSSLIERARVSNFDLALAQARVLEARALLDRVRGDAGPAVSAGAGYSWRESSTNTSGSSFASKGPTNLFLAGFDAIWELDLFGRNARGIEAAEANAQAAMEAGRDVLVTLFAEVARNYVELRATQRELELTRSNLATQQDTLDLVGVRARAGMATDFDVARAQTQVANTRSFIPQLEAREAQASFRIAVLLGQEPHAVERELSSVQPIPLAPPVTALGVPSSLLRRRADVRQAERELAQAAALSAQASAALFPQVSISASLGVAADTFSGLFDDGSSVVAISPSLSAPIFNSGALRAQVRAQGALQAQALARYQQAALVALREVEEGLVATDRERVRLESLREALASSRRALDLARELNSRGLVDFFEVLAAQGAAFAAESNVAQSEGLVCTNSIALYKALGGGWEN